MVLESNKVNSQRPTTRRSPSISMMERLAQAEGVVTCRTPPRAPSTGNSVSSDVSATTSAIASSSALVGECIMESHFSNANMRQRGEHTEESQSKREWVAGKVTAGLGWIQQQRERRKREALELEVEEQRQRLYEAQHGTTLEDNTTFQQLFPHDISIQASITGSGIQVDVLGIQDEEEDHVPQVRLEEEPSTAPPFILSREEMQQLSELALPISIAYSRWTRLYCLARDGDSFDAFLRKVEKQSHTLLVIRTTRGAVFGAYAESPWESHGPAFYGSAQASLFRFCDQELRVYKWTGENRYIQVCDANTKMIAFGGGGEEGAFGLSLEHDFRLGSTGACDTFKNEPLCEQENFEVVDVEVYSFLLGQF